MVQLSEIKHLIPDAMHNWLDKSDNFSKVRKSALDIISNQTDIGTSGERGEGGEWIVTAFAHIVEWLAGDAIPGISPEYAERRKQKYEYALKMLKSNKKQTPHGAAQQGEITEGIYTI